MDLSDKLRWAYGFCLLFIIAVLTGLIAMGRVEEQFSYGLHELILLLGLMVQDWVRWAFKTIAENKAKATKPIDG